MTFQNTLITAEADIAANALLAEGLYSAVNNAVAQRHPTQEHAEPPGSQMNRRPSSGQEEG
ncbi:MAG TPA: hypothetical protein VKY92_27510 [Verrucomicrobiae bacterium]|nr:hypothetical protein [Verrucomicrobiae bacterium]